MGQNLKDTHLFMQNSMCVEAPKLGARSLFKMQVTSRDRYVSTTEGNSVPKVSRFLQTGYNSIHKFS